MSYLVHSSFRTKPAQRHFFCIYYLRPKFEFAKRTRRGSKIGAWCYSKRDSFIDEFVKLRMQSKRLTLKSGVPQRVAEQWGHKGRAAPGADEAGSVKPDSECSLKQSENSVKVFSITSVFYVQSGLTVGYKMWQKYISQRPSRRQRSNYSSWKVSGSTTWTAVCWPSRDLLVCQKPDDVSLVR